MTHRRALWTTHATSLFLFWSRCGGLCVVQRCARSQRLATDSWDRFHGSSENNSQSIIHHIRRSYRLRTNTTACFRKDLPVVPVHLVAARPLRPHHFHSCPNSFSCKCHIVISKFLISLRSWINVLDGCVCCSLPGLIQHRLVLTHCALQSMVRPLCLPLSIGVVSDHVPRIHLKASHQLAAVQQPSRVSHHPFSNNSCIRLVRIAE